MGSGLMALCLGTRLGRVHSPVGWWLAVVMGVAALASPAAAGAVVPREGPSAAGSVAGHPALGGGDGALAAPVGERAAASSLRAWRALPAPARAAVSRTRGRDQAEY